MFYDETKAMQQCEDDPSLIFELMREGHMECVDKVLSKKKVSVNTYDEFGNDVLTKLLKLKQYDLVLKHMKQKDWDVNHQNNDGDTFAHVLATINYVNALQIINQLMKNKKFIPNIKNNKGETILDKSINDNYIYTAIKILEDERFTNIDIVSFQKLYNTYIKSNHYGKYSKVNNLEIIVDNLEEKELLPRMKKLLQFIVSNFEAIKQQLLANKLEYMDSIINLILQESSNV